MTRTARHLALFVFAACVATSSSAWARPLDPSTADRDAQQALTDGRYTFCKHPPTPLPPRAQSLCAIAREIPDCEGLVRACEGPKDDPSSWSFPSWLRAAFEFLATIGVWLLVAAIVALLAIPIVQGLLRARRDRNVADTKPPVGGDDAKEETAPLPDLLSATDAERLLRHAEELRAQGKLDRALFTFLHAALRALDDRGAIRIERHRTNGEYVRSCREDAARRGLRELVRDVDRVRFGGAPPDDASVARARERAVALVRVAVAVILAITLTGCTSAKRYLSGADPSENALFVDLLKRQGADVGTLGSSLATLKAPEPGKPSPIVVVDVERVPLADETREHLARWVEKGGTLVLAGDPASWPKDLGGAKAAKAASREIHAIEVVTEAVDDDAEEEREDLVVVDEPGILARPSALEWPVKKADVYGRFDDGKLYAGLLRHGEGKVLGVANDDLFTNAGLARPGNPRALMRILANLHGTEFKVARDVDGVIPPSNPLSALVEAGLGKALAHSPFAITLLFFAAGARFGRPRRAAPPARRAFAEHVEATGALYARTKVAAHALRTYARYAEGLLRAQMPRGTADIAGFIAARASLPLEECTRVWKRATESLSGAPPLGDELHALKDLSRVVGLATRRGRVPEASARPVDRPHVETPIQ